MLKNVVFFFCLLFIETTAFAQMPVKYTELINKAWAFYVAKDYKNSALTYSTAFKTNAWTSADRYNAACSWALVNNADSSFSQLNRAVHQAKYSNYDHIVEDTDLTILHTDKRWEPLLALVKENRDKEQSKFIQPVTRQLDTIYKEDQSSRLKISEIQQKYGNDSKEMTALWNLMGDKDSINLIKIKAILDQYGWLGAAEVGQQGNTTLFLVIQHADLATQQHYLPIMREAVKNGKAAASSLALLIDRVALGEGKKQIYGSQISMLIGAKTATVSPLEDPDNVDKRRASVGLNPIADYVKQWNIKWDVEQYKKDLQALEEKKAGKKLAL